MTQHGDSGAASRGVLRRSAALLLGLALFLSLAAAPAAQAQVDGISYTLSPRGEYVFYESDFLGGSSGGLENSYFYGGEVGLGFGQYLTVSGLYLLNQNAETDFSNFSIDDATARQEAVLAGLDSLSTRDVDLKRYGGEVKLNLGSGVGDEAEFLPYVSIGAGILEIDPEDRDATETIYATAGLGVTFSVLDRYTLSVGGQVLSYRYNVATTFLSDGDIEDINDEGGLTGDAAVEREDFNQVTVYAPSARASLEIFLGGRRPGELTDLDRAILNQFGDRNELQVFVEPFYGRINFNDALNFPKDQNVAGLNAGFELGPFVGIRGFYWRGVSGDDLLDEVPPDNFEDIAFYGGDLNLRFSSNFGQRSFTPFGILGAGYMDVLSDYADDVEDELDGDEFIPDDRYFGIAGGGVEVPLSDALVLQGSARYLFMSNEDVEDVSDPDNVFASLMYTAGLEFSLGKGDRGRSPGEIIEAQRERDLQQLSERERQRARATQQEIDRLQARLDSLERMNLTQEQERREMDRIRADVERAEREQRLREEEQMMRDGGERAVIRRGSNLSGETITLPIPEVGEVYIRVGETASDVSVETAYAPPTVIQGGQAGGFAGGLTQEQVSQAARDAMRDEMTRAEAEGRTLSEREIRRIVSETIRQEIQAAGGAVPSVSNEALRRELEEERQERRDLERRLEDLADELEEDIEDVEDRQGAPTVVQTGDEDGGTTTILGGGGYQPDRVVPTAGYAVGPGRFLVGARGDYGSEPGFGVGGLDFRFQPELMFGFGDGVSLDLLLNGIVDVNTFEQFIGDAASPYAGLGVGLTTETGLGINLLLGAEYELGGGAVFGEYSTVNFFDYNRFLIGYRTGF